MTDSGGLTTTKTVKLDTDAHDLSVASSPAGVPITVNQTDSITHPVVKAITGSQNRVVAPATYDGKVFVSWSDGGDADHSFTMPSHDVSLVADLHHATGRAGSGHARDGQRAAHHDAVRRRIDRCRRRRLDLRRGPSATARPARGATCRTPMTPPAPTPPG